MAEQAGLYHNVTSLVRDTEVRLAFHSEQIVRINQDFPWTTVNLAAFVLNCLTVLTVNAVVLVWLKMKGELQTNHWQSSTITENGLLLFLALPFMTHVPIPKCKRFVF